MNSKIKTVYFCYDNHEFRYKYSENEPWEVTEDVIKKKFELSPDISYTLYDLEDNCVVPGSQIRQRIL
jgi:hypothetical protein